MAGLERLEAPPRGDRGSGLHRRRETGEARRLRNRHPQDLTIPLAALQAAEDGAKQWPQVGGIDRIENRPHLRVTGDTLDAIEGAEVVVGVAAAVVEGQERGV